MGQKYHEIPGCKGYTFFKLRSVAPNCARLHRIALGVAPSKPAPKTPRNAASYEILRNLVENYPKAFAFKHRPNFPQSHSSAAGQALRALLDHQEPDREIPSQLMLVASPRSSFQKLCMVVFHSGGILPRLSAYQAGTRPAPRRAHEIGNGFKETRVLPNIPQREHVELFLLCHRLVELRLEPQITLPSRTLLKVLFIGAEKVLPELVWIAPRTVIHGLLHVSFMSRVYDFATKGLRTGEFRSSVKSWAAAFVHVFSH